MLFRGSVWPSGAALATKRAPIRVSAPGLFSTMTGWPKNFSIGVASVRARMSVAPPGDSGTIIRMGLLGNSCATAPDWHIPIAMTAKSVADQVNLVNGETGVVAKAKTVVSISLASATSTGNIGFTLGGDVTGGTLGSGDESIPDDFRGSATLNPWNPQTSNGAFVDLAPGETGSMPVTSRAPYAGERAALGWMLVSIDDPSGAPQADLVARP